ncbi:hypothetical protein OKW21_003112 [Catalinimonas alkaloidigena]|uniref:hypothetical protein n=1 Tax=Catalinimonas alkaloidigena TaxID=1075417 RepID=UPI00240725AE|nr:hypothetical protein [Catalinimonas alkaloidigena]MDF9797849.1 hypothetical protein [Catalinimonas alkaloidigena]
MKLIARFRITFAYLLLIVFSLVALPRELWHNSEHRSISIQDEHSAQAHLTATKELCPVCAIHIAPFISQIPWERQLEISEWQSHTPARYAAQECTLSTTLRQRGPPLG